MSGPMRIVVVDYDGGNLASAARACEEAAVREGIDAIVAITDDAASVRAADRIVLPGQGAFADCAEGLAAKPGLRAAITEAVEGGTPFLGICVGMQLMAERGLEHRTTEGLGWIGGEIALMAPRDASGAAMRLPQMGWNTLDIARAHPLMDGIDPGAHVYFVHSYALRGHRAEDVVATTEYGGEVPAVVARGNVAGMQFHVEKSQGVGLRLIGNFLRWSPG